MNNNLPFIIHRHEALIAGLHFDFRIKKPGTDKLFSFVLLPEQLKRRFQHKKPIYVIRANDHTIKWLEIEKIKIPKGNYGAGLITAVQKGNATLIKYKKDELLKIIINEDGEILPAGKYTLFYLGNKEEKKERRNRGISEIWIMFYKPIVEIQQEEDKSPIKKAFQSVNYILSI